MFVAILLLDVSVSHGGVKDDSFILFGNHHFHEPQRKRSAGNINVDTVHIENSSKQTLAHSMLCLLYSV